MLPKFIWIFLYLVSTSLSQQSWQQQQQQQQHRQQHRQGDEEVDPKDRWYTRYPHYPSYCSTPSQMEQRSIPPLKPGAPKTKLLHVTAIVRHGARTLPEGPWEKNYQCWDDYWTNPETATWKCPLKTLYMPPSPERVMEQEKADQLIAQEFQHTMFLFTKNYDALKSPLTNILNGTCQLGQLILQGYEQQVKNGQFLREAYLWEEGSSPNLQLFQVGGGDVTEPWADNTQLYLRSDDSQATLMSGQLLMRGLFQKELIRSRAQSKDSEADAKTFPTIPVHTADHARDILGGFREHCDALSQLQAASDSSYDYQRYIESQEVKQVQEFLENHLRHESSLLDCLMTTVCTDRPLPDRFGIYDPHPKSWFNRISTYYTKNHSFHLNYNDAG